MGILTSIAIGGAAFLCYAGVMMAAIDQKLQKYYINIDAVNKKLEIRCDSRELPQDSFKVYVRLENEKYNLYVMGAAISDNNRDVITVKQKYQITAGDCADYTNLSWNIVNDEVVVNIPLIRIDGKLKVKKVLI